MKKLSLEKLEKIEGSVSLIHNEDPCERSWAQWFAVGVVTQAFSGPFGYASTIAVSEACS